MIRDDGSVRSVNEPVWANRHQVRDYGLYRGVVREVVYTDDERNDSGAGEPNEVVYNLMVIGGDRDGQLFNNARLVRTLGGWDNFEEIVLKQLEGLTKSDPTSEVALGDLPISDTPTFNGDVVYFQFLNGDLHMPVIIGMGYHQAAEAEASADDGQRSRKKFNGILTEITKDGEFTWSKDNGSSVPVLPNPSDPLYPFVNQFAPIPGQDGAVVFTLGNELDLSFDYYTGLNVTIDGIADEFSFTSAGGAGYTLNGLSDSHEFATTVGTSVTIDGAGDSVGIDSAAGASIVVNGLQDSIDATTVSGAGLSISADGGIVAQDALGDKLEMSAGAVTLQNAAGAMLTFNEAGFVELGNSGAKLFADIIIPLLQSMATASYAGFGAPGSNVADFIQLLVKANLIAGA